jgi:LPS export ABC transporter permease LptG/LPS export ABC transporter permease LptF
VRIFTRYILKEVLWHGLIGASIFTFVIFMVLVSRINAPVASIAQLFSLTLPRAFTITIPMGVLVGVLIGLSRLASDSEVTAMRTSGMSVRTFLKPIAIFGIGAWLLALANMLIVGPWSEIALANLQKNVAPSQLLSGVQPRVFYDNLLKNYVLYVEDVTTVGGTVVWKNVFLADVSTPGSPKITIAKQAIPTSRGNTIHLHLTKGENHESNAQAPDQYNISTFEETDTAFVLPSGPKPTETPSAKQAHTPEKQLSTRSLLYEAKSADKEWSRKTLIEFHRRLALPSACLVLVLIGIPLGLSARKGGRGAGFVLTIVLVFIYYFISNVGVVLATSGRVPLVLGVWMANIIFFIVGLVFLWRTDKIPIEIGIGQIFLSRVTNWTQSWLEGREPAAGNGQRMSRTGLGWILVVPLGLAILVLAFFGPVPRLLGKVPSAVGEEYFYPLLSLFALAVLILFAQRFLFLLDAYVLRKFASLLVLILFSFLVLTLIFTFFELLSDIVRNKIPLTTIATYLVNEIPAMLYLVTPLSVLLAVLVAFGVMQKSNEITAMKATGVSIYRTLIPVLAISASLAGGLFLLDQWYLPYANKRVETLRNTIKGRPPQTYQRPSKWIFGESTAGPGKEKKRKVYYYEFYDAERNEFGGISSFELDPQTFQIAARVYAARARWRDNMQKWVLENGWQRAFDGDNVTAFNQFEVTVLPEMTEQPSYFKKEVRQYSEMNYEELRNYIRDLQQSGFDVVRLRVQLQKKIAFPLITLVMAVLALPFALSAGRRGALSGVAVALLIAGSYWVASLLFESLGNGSQLPPLLAAWMPDVIFGLAGGYMIFKTPS